MEGVFSNNAAYDELKRRFIFVLCAIAIFRLGVHTPLPGVDLSIVADIFKNSKATLLLGYFDLFSGGALSNMSLLTLSIYPYINASIFIQLVSHVYPPLIALRKEGDSGRRKLNQYTRYLTYLLALIQSYGAARFLLSMNATSLTPLLFSYLTVLSLSTGTMFLVWLADQITRHGIGNGISVLMFTGIVIRMPEALLSVFSQARQGQLSALTLFSIIALLGTLLTLIVFIERAQRKIALSYPKRQHMLRGSAGLTNNYLPFKISMSGVLPPITAQMLIVLPITAVDFLVSSFSTSSWAVYLGQLTVQLHPGQPLYIALFSLLVVCFAYLLTQTLVDTRQISEHIRKSGAMISGIRPGQKTAEYLNTLLGRLTLFGGLYLALVAALPDVILRFMKVPALFGGTSLLIIVVVVMELISQVQSMLLPSAPGAGKHHGKSGRRVRLLG